MKANSTMVFHVPKICKNKKLDEKLLREIILGIHFVNVLLSWQNSQKRNDKRVYGC